MSAQVWACDGCGTSSSNIGMLSAYRNNFVSFGIQQASFATNSEHENTTIDHFYQFKLSARYYLTNRFKVLVKVPYALHIRQIKSNKNSIKGLADIQIIGSYTFLQDLAIGEQIQLFAEINLGLKMPTGHYDSKLYQSNLPENFNIGTGNWSGTLQPNFVLSYRNVGGLQISGMYQHNSLSKGGYRFGNQWNTQVMLFAQQNFIRESQIIAQIGCLLEKATSDKYANKNTVAYTGGSGTFGLAAFNIKTEKWLAGYSYALPFVSNYADGQVMAKARNSMQVSFVF